MHVAGGAPLRSSREVGQQGPRAYDALAGHEVEPAGRLARLMADHPPLGERIERLRGYSAPSDPTTTVPASMS
jgi:Zn-dependent protease with chaperone function